MDVGAVGGANEELFGGDEAVLGVEIEGVEAFLLAVSDLGADEPGGAGAGGDAFTFLLALHEGESASELDGCQEHAGFAGADAFDLAEGAHVLVQQSFEAACVGEDDRSEVGDVMEDGACLQEDGEELGIGEVLRGTLDEALTWTQLEGAVFEAWLFWFFRGLHWSSSSHSASIWRTRSSGRPTTLS